MPGAIEILFTSGCPPPHPPFLASINPPMGQTESSCCRILAGGQDDVGRLLRTELQNAIFGGEGLLHRTEARAQGQLVKSCDRGAWRQGSVAIPSHQPVRYLTTCDDVPSLDQTLGRVGGSEGREDTGRFLAIIQPTSPILCLPPPPPMVLRNRN